MGSGLATVHRVVARAGHTRRPESGDGVGVRTASGSGRAVGTTLSVLLALTLPACGGVKQECIDAAIGLAPAAIALVDGLPAGLAAVPAEELRAEVDDRDGQTLDQVLLAMNRLGLGGLDPGPGQDPGEVRAALDLARDAGCEVGDLRPTLAEAFTEAAASADAASAARYAVVAEALRPAD